MTPADTANLAEESSIATPLGRLHACRWAVHGAHRPQPPIVLLHDSLGSVDLWRSFPQALAARTGREVVAYDRLGFGRSDPHPGRLALDFVQQEAQGDFAAVLAHFGIDRFVAFGHSVGGGMALCIGAAYPARCRAVVVESAQAFAEALTLDGVRAAKASFAEPGQVERLGRYHGEKAPWVLAAWTDTWLAPAFAGWSLDAELQRLRQPTLVLRGGEDEFGSAAHAERIAAQTAGEVTVREFASAGHVPHKDAAEGVLDAVVDFLGTVDAT